MVGTRDMFIHCRDESLDDKDVSRIFCVGEGESIPGRGHYSFSKCASSGTCRKCKGHAGQEQRGRRAAEQMESLWCELVRKARRTALPGCPSAKFN